MNSLFPRHNPPPIPHTLHHFIIPSSDSRVQAPRDVSSPQHQHPIVIVPHSLHLHEELRLDTSRWLTLTFTTGRAQGIHFVQENYSRFVLSRRLSVYSRIYNLLFTLTDPFRKEIWCRCTDKSGIFSFCGNSLSQIKLSSTGRLKQIKNEENESLNKRAIFDNN